MNPLISVIVPVYNGAAFITETLESLRSQTYSNWECIVVDDGSTDDTAVVVKRWIASDLRFAYVYQANKGLSGARNSGLTRANGQFIQFLDADDVVLPEKFGKQIAALSNLAPGELAVSYTDYMTGRSGNIYEAADYYVDSAFHSVNPLLELISRWEATLSIPPHCFLFSTDLFLGKGIRFDQQLRNHEDFECWVNVFRLKPRVVYVAEKLCIYRITDGSMSKNMRAMGEGFVQALENQIRSAGWSKAERRVLIRKRRAVLGWYRRFDLMTWKDKLLSLDVLFRYYTRRIPQKLGVTN